MSGDSVRGCERDYYQVLNMSPHMTGAPELHISYMCVMFAGGQDMTKREGKFLLAPLM